MSKISSRPITPFKRRRFGVSLTASQGITDAVVVVARRAGTLSKFKARRLLKAAGVRRHKLLQ